MPLTAYVGPAGAGKTTRLIGELRAASDAGRPVSLFLCSDSAELRSRPHVKEGGLMGCRTPGVFFEITHFVSSDDARVLLADIPPGAVAAFDEASWFGPGLVSAWVDASRTGVDVFVSSMSEDQIQLLESEGHTMTRMSNPCMLCEASEATEDMEVRSTIESGVLRVCRRCLEAVDRNRAEQSGVAALLADLEKINPFPNETHSYQPLYQIDTEGWRFVRPDSAQRAEIMLAAYNEYFSPLQPADQPLASKTYLDFGCATGYFCEFMDDNGFVSAGVDIDEGFVRVARQVSSVRGSDVEYIKSDALSFIDDNPDRRFDVTSCFATIQWVMAQSGLEAGLRCFDWIFDATEQMCVIEIGYSSEEIYSENLPVKIDRDWMRDTMVSQGEFDEVLFFESSAHNTWRDQFVGLRNPAPVPDDRFRLPMVDEGTVARQIGVPTGVWEDGWVGARWSFLVALGAPVGFMKLSGSMPDWMDGKSTIRVSSPSHQTSVDVTPGAVFEAEVGVVAAPGDVLSFSVESDTVRQAPTQDRRDLAFHLRTITFAS